MKGYIMGYNDYRGTHDQDLYVDSKGRTYIKILNMAALSKKMQKKLGSNWKEQCIKTYGTEQLFGY